MNRTRSNLARATGTPRSLLKKTAAALIAAAALVAPAAQAGLVTFENLDPTAYLVGDSFNSDGMTFLSVDTEGVAAAGTSLSGAIFDSTDAGSCFFDCPLSNGGKYYAGLADGALIGQSTNAGYFKLAGFDASFIGLGVNGTYPTVPAYLKVMGFANHQTVQQFFALDPKGPNGFEFSRYNTNFADLELNAFAVFAYGCSSNSISSCTPYGNYISQFALDNVDITHVPEPASIMTMLLGLAGMGAAARRRRSK